VIPRRPERCRATARARADRIDARRLVLQRAVSGCRTRRWHPPTFSAYATRRGSAGSRRSVIFWPAQRARAGRTARRRGSGSEDIAFRVIAAQRKPDHATIARFRRAAPGCAGGRVRAGSRTVRAGWAGRVEHRRHRRQQDRS
jgi:hypothetical protein